MKKPKMIELTPQQIDALLERVATGRLEEGDYEIIAGIVEAFKTLSLAVEKKDTSLQRILRLMFGAKTESSKNVLGEENASPATSKSGKDPPDSPKEDRENSKGQKKKRKGHGRNGADHYPGATRRKVTHSTLKAADPCPQCEKGKVYPLKIPGTVVRITGVPPIQADVYELEKLRCNLCGEVFTADLPDQAGEEKYDPSSGATVAVLKYGNGFPFKRLEKLQESLGVPFSASTQWEVVEKLANRIHPVYLELIRQAAQGDVLYHDDTPVKILDLMKENNEDEPSRKGMFTSGFFSSHGKVKISLFFTGRKHAGENMAALLEQREEQAKLPIQMCDALSRNMSAEFKTILANCLVHARRNFVDVTENFPQECRFVLKILQNVYHNDKITKEQNMSAEQRLKYHQEKSDSPMKKLHQWLRGQFEEKKVEPNSGLGKAISYMLKHWEALTLFLRVPKAPLDNNLCEQALKRAILHRKNSLFYKTEHGAYIGDLFMSLIHTCRLSHINPFDYLTVLQKHAAFLKNNPQNWMPWNYQTTVNAWEK